MADLYDAYINSEDYNRVGTSVKWSHNRAHNYTYDSQERLHRR